MITDNKTQSRFTMKTIQVNGQTVALGNIFCIGRNYRQHIRELNHDTPSEPVVFLKPNSALAVEGEAIVLPEYSQDVHHECELVVYIARDANHIQANEARHYVGGYGLGLDLTARDIQQVCKEKGLPWTPAKGFRTAACVSSFVAADKVADIQGQQFCLTVNGTIRQQGHTADMIFPVDQIIAYLSDVYGLQTGDIIYTGTPAGVASLHSGDQLTLSWPDKIEANFQVA